MVKTMQINLNKTAYDLTKSVNSLDLAKPTPSFDLTKSTNNINLVKNLDSLELVKKNVVSNLQTLAKKPKSPGGWPDINFTDAADTLTKIPIQPFELYWTSKTAEPDYPNGLPFSFLPIGLEPEIVLDSCHIGIGVQPVLGFIKLPQQQIVYKYAECDPNKFPNPPPPTTPNSVYLPPAPPGCWYNTYWSRTLIGSYRRSETGEGDYYDAEVVYEAFNIELPDPIKYVVERKTVNGAQTYYYEGEAKPVVSQHNGPVFERPNIVTSFYYAKAGQDVAALDGIEKVLQGYGSQVVYQGNYTSNATIQTQSVKGGINTIETGTFTDTHILATRTYGGETTAVIPIGGGSSSDLAYTYYNSPVYGYAASYLICNGTPYDYTQSNPPPPPLVLPPPPNQAPPKGMNCCPQVLGLLQFLIVRVNQLDGKIQLLDQELKDTNKCLGVDEYPMSLPKRLIYPNANGVEKVENIVQALGYQIKQIDKAVGYLPQKIKVLDTNSAQAGNQSVEVEIHSFADFAKETLQYLIDTEGDDDTLTNIAVRILYECGAVHQLSVQIAAMVDAAIEHLDFKETWKTVEVPFAYDPYAGQKGKKAGDGFGSSTKDPLPLTEEELEKLMPDLLKETLVKIKVLVNTQKRTLNDLLQELLRDARLAAAGVSENASRKRLVEIVESAQAALQLQNTIARNNVRKALTSGDLRTRKKPKQ